MHHNIEIIVGTYEAFLLGYKVEYHNDKHTLVQSFADKSHTAAIKCVAVNDKWIATGGADDRIFIYDMAARKQSQCLMEHEGSVNTLDFSPDGSHLLSGADDGSIIVTSTKTWYPKALWKKVHDEKAVNQITCHPSGKLAFSLGANLILCTWNLAKGRVAYKKNLKSRSTLGRQPDCLKLSPNGQKFVICGPRIVEIWSLSKGDVEHSIKTTSKPICVAWLKDDTCLVGLENGNIFWIDMCSSDNNTKDEGLIINEIPAHSARVKAMSILQNYLVTSSSSGEIKLWELLVEKKERLTEIALTNIGCRPTTINILQQQKSIETPINQVLTENDCENQSDLKMNSAKIPPRGVVTIEYDDKDENETYNEHKYVKQNLKTEEDNVKKRILDSDSIKSSKFGKRNLQLKRKESPKLVTKETLPVKKSRKC